MPSQASATARQAPSALPSLGPTLDCLGVGVARPTWARFRDWFFEVGHARSGGARSLYFVNAHTLNLAWEDPSYREVLNRGDVVLNDGFGLDLYARLAAPAGAGFEHNFNGTDLFPALFETAEADAPLRVFLYGAAPGRAERAAAKIEERFPGVRVVGTRHGFQQRSVVQMINRSGAHLLLVAKGNPIQERWIDENKPLLTVGIVAGVGALIDFLSGEIRRAPTVFRQVRLEWAYRLALEPKRMFSRYVLGNPAFLARSVVHVLRRER